MPVFPQADLSQVVVDKRIVFYARIWGGAPDDFQAVCVCLSVSVCLWELGNPSKWRLRASCLSHALTCFAKAEGGGSCKIRAETLLTWLVFGVTLAEHPETNLGPPASRALFYPFLVGRVSLLN